MIDPVPASFVTLGLLLMLVGLLLSAGVVFLMARTLVRPPRMSDGKAAAVLRRLSPGDLGLRYEETAFDVRDAATGAPLRLSAWWIPHPQAAGRCAVLLHGYADAKVGAIAWAPTWHALGWNVLALDLRAHGQSGGTYCTGGYFERHDVGDVLNQLRARLPGDTRQLVLFGASFGAAVAVATAALRDDVDAVVLDSPPPDFAAAATLHMTGLGAPGGPLPRLAVRLAERLTGADFASVRTVDLLPSLSCPALLIVPERDPFIPPAAADAYRAALATRSAEAGVGESWHVAGAGHLMALPTDAAEYRRRLGAFLAGVDSPAPARPPGGLPHTSAVAPAR